MQSKRQLDEDELERARANSEELAERIARPSDCLNVFIWGQPTSCLASAAARGTGSFHGLAVVNAASRGEAGARVNTTR